MLEDIKRITIRKFLTFGRCSGKTWSTINQAKREQLNGKKCAIVVFNHEVITHNENRNLFNVFPNINEPRKLTSDKIDVINAKTVIDILQNEVERGNNLETWWKQYPQFKDYDFVYVDPECYEYIIYELLSRLNTITRELNELKQVTNEKLDSIEKIGE